MAPRSSIKMTNAALDEEKDDIILRGVIDPNSLHLLKVADYQREVLPLVKIRTLANAFKNGSAVPDIDLGMRGGAYVERDNAFFLQDDVYIIDGLQRQTAALEYMKTGGIPRLGAVIHFNTNEETERDRFRVLNMARSKLSPNVLIRNLRTSSSAVEMLFNLSNDSSFVLNRRISWNQRMHREHLISAMTLLKVASHVHEQLGAGMKSSSHEDLVGAMDRVINKHGRTTIRNNVKTFWEVMDECWKVKIVTFKEGAIHLRSTFLISLAMVLANHEDFWDDNKLIVRADLRRKMSTFPLNDPQIANLAGAGSTARNLLYQLFVNHINSGKRTKRLTSVRKMQLKEARVIVAAADVELEELQER